MPTVPAEVVVGPVTVLLTICIIVLAIVGNQVIQGEAVVRNDEVDTLVGLPARFAHEEMLLPSKMKQYLLESLAVNTYQPNEDCA